MGDGCGNGTRGGKRPNEPTTEIGRAVRDVLAAAPQIITTLQARPEQGCGVRATGCEHDAYVGQDCCADTEGAGDRQVCGGQCQCDGRCRCTCPPDCLDPPLRKVIDEIRDGLRQMRNPAGVVANCNDALKRLIAAFGEISGSSSHGHHDHADPRANLVGAVLIALAAVAIAFLLFANHTDAVFQAGVDPDYRAMAYPAAVDAPNLGTWLAWIVLALAVVGAAIWTMGRMPAIGPKPPSHDHAGLKDLYDRGLISRDLYERGNRLASDDPLTRPAAGESYAREYGAYTLALADALCHRRTLGDAAGYREASATAGRAHAH